MTEEIIAKRMCLAYCTLEDILEAYPWCTEGEAMRKALTETFTEQEADEILAQVLPLHGYRAMEDMLQDRIIESVKGLIRTMSESSKRRLLDILATNDVPHCNDYYTSTPDDEWVYHNFTEEA